MCIKTVCTNLSAIQFVSECYKSKEICDKAVDTCSFVFDSVSYEYNTQEMCDIAVDSYLLALTFVPDDLLQIR